MQHAFLYTKVSEIQQYLLYITYLYGTLVIFVHFYTITIDMYIKTCKNMKSVKKLTKPWTQ